ncbi:MAG: adaptor protein MecA [Lachnospiraceae bacterium]|nr:adaptor protein MecA [Lachnospiraceae bacterium]
MKIERVNENQIRCILTREDLEERKIKFSELTYGSEKANRLFKDVMQQANFEYGFSVDEHPLMIEAVPMQSGMIVFVITKVTTPDEFDSHLSRFVNALREETEGDADSEEFDDAAAGEEEGGITAQLRISGATEADEAAVGSLSLRDLFREMFSRGPAAEAPEKEKPAGTVRQKDRIFVFDGIGSVIDAARSLSGTETGESCLYKNPADGRYYLLVYADYLTPAGYNRLCTAMADFCENEKYSSTLESYMEEHFEIVLAEHALQALSGV